MYNTQYSNTGYTLELSHSNMTKCCNNDGSLYLRTSQEFGQAKVLFNHLKLSHNKADSGGGILADLQGNGNVALVISNCVLFNGSAAFDGGGLRLYVSISQTAAITIENTEFVDNKADLYGGGISAILEGNGNVVISNCVLYNGSAALYGGGLYVSISQTAAITIENTKFVDNKADLYGGGISAILEGNGNVVISNCVLYNGSAALYGGGLYVSISQTAAITIENTKFVDNKADLYGGGISADLQGNGSVTLVISNCLLFNGSAMSIGGGGLSLSVSISQTAAIAIENTKFVDNKAHHGGGISAGLYGNGNVTLLISNCVLYNGSAAVHGGGLYVSISQTAAITIENTKFVDNKAIFGGGISADLQGNGDVTLVISNCVLFNGSSMIRGGGLILSVAIQTAAITIENTKFVDNKADLYGGGISADLQGNGSVTLVISNCVLFNGSAMSRGSGGLSLSVSIQSATIRIENTDFMDNYGQFTNEIDIHIQTGIHSSPPDVTFIMLNSTVQSEAYSAHYGVVIRGCCVNVMLTNTSMIFANIHSKGFVLICTSSIIKTRIQMDSCQFIGSSGVPSIIYMSQVQANITNCIFSNNTSDANGRSVITLQQTGFGDVIHSCTISDNDMTGIIVILTSCKIQWSQCDTKAATGKHRCRLVREQC